MSFQLRDNYQECDNNIQDEIFNMVFLTLPKEESYSRTVTAFLDVNQRFLLSLIGMFLAMAHLHQNQLKIMFDDSQDFVFYKYL